MYFIFSYEFSAENQGNAQQINQFISRTINNLGVTQIAQPLKNTYLIRCDNAEIRRAFVNQMLVYVQNLTPPRFKYIISPLIDSATINAFVPQNMFDNIRGVISSTYGGGIGF